MGRNSKLQHGMNVTFFISGHLTKSQPVRYHDTGMTLLIETLSSSFFIY